MNAISKPFYIVIWAILMVLLFFTWGAAQFDMGIFNTIAALLIATAKMTLVILFFMHVRYNSRLTWLFACAGFVWLMIMLTFTLTDYFTRYPVGIYEKEKAQVQMHSAPYDNSLNHENAKSNDH